MSFIDDCQRLVKVLPFENLNHKNIKNIVDEIVEIGIKIQLNFSEQNLLTYSKGFLTEKTLENLEKIRLYQNDFPRECHILLELNSNENIENDEQVTEFWNKLQSHIDCRNPINAAIKSKTLELAKIKEFRPKIIQFANKAIHQGYDFDIEELSSSENCSIKDYIQSLPNLFVHDSLSDENLDKVKANCNNYIENVEDNEYNMQDLSTLLEIARLGLQYGKQIFTPDMILIIVQNEDIDKTIRLQAASILAYYKDSNKFCRNALKTLKLKKITDNKQNDISIHFYQDKYQIELDEINKNIYYK